ncbi:MAG: hypothetical protein IIB89_11270, partial [Chloroflexi bacterium]|nr:hypothetical protein [Chloroflexota bacterium]
LGLAFGLSATALLCIFFLPSTHQHQLPDWEDELPPEARMSRGAPAVAPAAGGGDGSND